MDRAELADFLRRRRERLHPADVGLPPGVRRRTPGLRRDEVAQLAGMSTDYYTRLEQARGPHPSTGVLGGLARALRLSDDERDHLYRLAGQAAPHRSPGDPHVGPGLLHVLSRLDDVAAFIIDDLGNLLVQNQMSVLIGGDGSAHRGRMRNFTWRWFTDPGTRATYPQEDWSRLSYTHVADLRATFARRAGDADVEELVADLRAASDEFEQLWAEHAVRVRRNDAKRIHHPDVGLLDLLCEHLESSATGHRLVVLLPRPGTDTRAKLDLLRVVGHQDMTTSEPQPRL